MARKRSLFFHRLPTVLKYFLLGISLTLLIIFGQGQAKSQLSSSSLSQAQQLTQTGHEQLHRGQASAALQTWEAAYQTYYRLNDSEGMAGSLINQSLALQATGSYLEACRTLIQALKLEDWICENPQLQQLSLDKSQKHLNALLEKEPLMKSQVIGLQNLGDVLRLIGKPEASYFVLQKALLMAGSLRLTSSTLNAQLLLSLGHTERALYAQAKNIYQLIDEPGAKQEALIKAQSKAQSALELYQKVGVEQSGIALQAQLNQVSLLLDLEKLSAAEINVKLEAEIQSLQDLIKQLLTKPQQFETLPVIQSIYARLNLAISLIQIDQNIKLRRLIFSQEENPLSTALLLAKNALFSAQEIDNLRAESYSLGTFGNIYFYLGKIPEATHYFERAMGLAQSVQAWDIAYQWQWKLGRLYQLSEKLGKASDAYEAAISSLDQVRGNILSINPELQFAFKEKVEPVYYEYMELLSFQKRANLEQVTEVHEKLRIAELENFLQCGQLPIFSGKQNFQDLSSTIHLIKLGDQVEIILKQSPNNFYSYTVELKVINEDLNNLLKLSQSQDFIETEKVDFLVYSQNLYKWLFAPIKKYLPESGNLTFILDSYFYNLPISMLHDGQKYLNESYSISIASSSRFWQRQSSLSKHSRVLLGGISDVSPSFKAPLVLKNLKPLPEVKTEIENIKRNTASATELLNPEFTSHNFRKKVENGSFQVIHLSTHAQFSSDPEQNFFLTWDKPFNVKEFKFLLKNQYSPIDLLVLSACQTAKGDRRSALGIAGMAAQAGAQSTIATLWLVDADSTAQLMKEFYVGLKNGMFKTEALRQAQLKLMSNPKYSHPYFWSGFVLVGNWL